MGPGCSLYMRSCSLMEVWLALRRLAGFRSSWETIPGWSRELERLKISVPTHFDSNGILALCQILKNHVISLILSYFKISYLSDIGFSCISHTWFRILPLAFRTTNLPLIDFSAHHFFCFLDSIIIAHLHVVILSLNDDCSSCEEELEGFLWSSAWMMEWWNGWLLIQRSYL